MKKTTAWRRSWQAAETSLYLCVSPLRLTGTSSITHAGAKAIHLYTNQADVSQANAFVCFKAE